MWKLLCFEVRAVREMLERINFWCMHSTYWFWMRHLNFHHLKVFNSTLWLYLLLQLHKIYKDTVLVPKYSDYMPLCWLGLLQVFFLGKIILVFALIEWLHCMGCYNYSVFTQDSCNSSPVTMWNKLLLCSSQKYACNISSSFCFWAQHSSLSVTIL